MKNTEPIVTLKSVQSAMRNQSAEARKLVEKAWHFAEKAHEDQKRLSGELHFPGHVTIVAQYLAEAGMDAQTIAAALLHDTLEDTDTTAEELEKEFGKEVCFLVEGVTKLGKLKYRGLERHVESLRRLLIATASDIRVVIIKLYDRLQNMQTNEFHTPERQKRKALETMEVYVPIAERLGIGTIKTQLEDLSFKTLDPEQYKESAQFLKEKQTELKTRIDDDIKDLKKYFGESGIRKFRTEYRFKSIYSFDRKLARKNGDVDSVYDIVALRIIVPTTDECYRSLGFIHGLWRPIPGRVKDYIAFPKPNGYRSIHTTIITRRGVTIEVQIRTEKMHQEAQFGIASHFNYKTGKLNEYATDWFRGMLPSLLRRVKSADDPEAPLWLKDLTVVEKDHPDYETFEEILKQDFFAERMFVFTPKGDVIDLPVGATPIDFAYAIHSDIGDTTTSAKVDGKMVSLDTLLRNGNVVEIGTKKNEKPNKKWLESVKTAGAKSHIKSALREKEN